MPEKQNATKTQSVVRALKATGIRISARFRSGFSLRAAT